MAPIVTPQRALRSDPLDEIYNYVVIQNFGESSRGIKSNRESTIGLSRIESPHNDAALGVGQIFSYGSSLQLFQKITPRISQFAAGAARAMGGLLTAVSAGARIVHLYSQERSSGAETFPETQKEIVVSAASIGSGFLVGSVWGVGVATLSTLGAPLALVAGVGIAGALLVGWVTDTVRERARTLIS